MRIFILTDANWVTPRVIIFEKVIEIIESGMASTQLHFYVVGEYFSTDLASKYANMVEVSFMNRLEAEKKLTEVSNACIVHFGAQLNGSDRFPQYFIPLTHPGLASHLSLLQSLQYKISYSTYIKKAVAIYCTNDWALQSMKHKFSKQSDRFVDAFLPPAHLPAFEWHHLSALKNELTQGNHFFLAFIPIARFVETLKEFSIFKKWQQTSMSIVFVFDHPIDMQNAAEMLKGYKFRDAVVLQTIDQVKLEWIAATYAILWEAVDFDKSFVMEWAVQYDIPMLFDQNSSQPETWKKAGEVFSFTEKLALSNHFKLYYKDEVYRQARARMGREWLQAILSQRSANQLPHPPLVFHT